MKVFVFILTLIAAPLAAQEIDSARVLANVRACFDAADATMSGKQACIGEAALLCMDETEGGYSTLGQSQCQQAEAEAWDVLLNEQYRVAMDFAKGGDADETEAVFARRAETLRAMQRAWIPFRDAKCAAEYAKWGMGSMRNIAGSGCLMQTNAEQTIQLWGMYDAFR